MSAFDVVVPCYNYARYLRGCVASILSQRDVAVRVLIIDDRSSDDTQAVGEALAAADPRVTFRRHDVNAGLIRTANEGVMDWAASKYTLLLSADDALTPGAFARAAAIMDADPEISMTYGLASVIGDGETLPDVADQGAPDYRIVPGAKIIEYSCLHANPAPSPTAVVRTSVQHRIGGYSASLPHTSDMEMWMRFALEGPIGIIRQPQGFYRWHGANMAIQHTSGALSDRAHRLATCRKVFDEHDGRAIPGFSDWLTALTRKFAVEATYLAGLAYAQGDNDAYRACKAFAAECEPKLRADRVLLRHRIKRLMGEKAAGALRGLASSAVTAEEGNSWAANNRLYGWWPDAA
jgi:glycosyltransferase involved in cell wall biosynthesis